MGDIDVLHANRDRFLVEIRDHTLVVDQPRGVGGDDVGPTPTELFVAGLASCVAFYAERFMTRHGIPPHGLKVECDFDVSHAGRPRVDSVDLAVVLPDGFPEERRAALLAVVENCTVENSLRQPPVVRVSVDERETVAA